ncbi:NAD(P)/FAD-dependent oxidoreductase [Candidatus Soleaferrea massiliensis]|uniref:NAD(P)/FAD-dependent oxidoreductase n=1 Tax=Candidatus Soleaferrea massiliensis TaxID=1470354 RepID=UPI0005914524|nr:FAD-dependent oxidoreductase [Candidatus Soleaferrea massiliensis]
MPDFILSNPIKTGAQRVPYQYAWLSENESCDVAIVGGGVSAALCAYYFAKSHIKTVLVTSKPVGYGKSCAFTSQFQYECFPNLSQVIKKAGKDQAVSLFKLGMEGLNNIEELCSELADDCGCQKRDCFYYTHDEEHYDDIYAEYLMRRHLGCDVEFLDKKTARDRFSFPLEAGVYMKNAACDIDNYLFTQELIHEASLRGCRVYENTAVEEISSFDDHVVLNTSTGRSVTANKVILSTGFSLSHYLGLPVVSRTAFMVATKPVPDYTGWENRCIIRDIDRPYNQFKTTADSRIIASRIENLFVKTDGRISKLMPAKRVFQNQYAQMTERLNEMFPAITGIRPEFEYAGRFVETRDLLPYVGEHENYGNVYFNLCTGSSAALLSEQSARLLLDLYQNKPNENRAVFSPQKRSGGKSAAAR